MKLTKIKFTLLIALISANISFAQKLVMEKDLITQRFGKDIYYKDSNNNLLNGNYKIADTRGNYSDLTFKEGKKHGKNVDYDWNGRIVKAATYENGTYVGTYTTYHQNGKIELVGKFSNGKKDGKWEVFNSKGKTTDIEYYTEGKRSGKWEYFDKYGKIRAIKYFSNNQKTGKWWHRKYYAQYGTHTILIENYKNDKHFGYAVEKKEDGTLKWEREYKDRNNYMHKEYNESGKLHSKYQIINGRIEGKKLVYTSNGTTLLKTDIYDKGKLVKSSNNNNITVTINNSPKPYNRGSQPKSIKNKISSYNYKALLISNENYTNGVSKLNFPNKDAVNLGHALRSFYNFKDENIIHLKDATRYDIISTLDSLAATITEKDNLLIFYAGHGVFDKTLNKGYWIPVDATVDKKNNWVSNSDIRDYITAFKSQHTLLISDACFSGSIFEYKQRSLDSREKTITEKLLSKKSRKAMTSGLNKTVPDKSMFIKYLIKTLKDNQKQYLRAGELYNDIREAVMANTDNNPQFEVIKNSNHEGGEFIFMKKK